MTLNCKGRVQVIIDAWADGGAEHVPVEGGGGLQVGDGDSDVVANRKLPRGGELSKLPNVSFKCRAPIE